MSYPRHSLIGTDDNGSQAPIVTTKVDLLNVGGSLDGILLGAFQGFDPPVAGNLTIALGNTAYLTPGATQEAAPLTHVIEGSPVVDPTVLTDLTFATPASGPDNGSVTDIGIAATTGAYSSLILPLDAALKGTTLGKYLDTLVRVSGALLPGFGQHHGVPKGGSHDAQPLFGLSAGLSLSNTTTLLGIPFTTSSGGSLDLGQANLSPLTATLADGAALFSDTGTMVNDISSGNIAGAIAAGIATLADGTALVGAAGTLIAEAAHQHYTPLPEITNPALSLDLNVQDSQSVQLGLGTPTQVQEQLDVRITGDSFGAYALGRVLALYAPQLVADLTGNALSPESTFGQLAQGVSTLSQDMLTGKVPNGGSVPSSTTLPDIGISATLITTETQALIGGDESASQTFALNFETNAQGFYDLGVVAQSALTALLAGLLETQGGQEAIAIGGKILSQINHKLGGGDALMPEHHGLPHVSW